MNADVWGEWILEVQGVFGEGIYPRSAAQQSQILNVGFQ
jgi:hypothetical protein